ncbi:DNA polymerase III subunit alpha [Bacillus aquiflavi]|uniref:DNA polymerase III subunit alpha n=1 Tax=Bacillus aquiflavi TaxID=2672567 RepID=A0A6B3VTV5_9BACI|nr:DNA polymerase III subunit alpha [Bacillus aquiflavi]MBA4537112.1 DNA polymerase III subunit alpha [Bacillus aquiflavi]NEY81409.1 DNA polymerase III subunit alpha [Bacillus aquiflavi]
MSFIHLHVYSAYSLLTSTATVEKLVSAAKEKGFSALALTDRNVMYGSIAFYKECLKQSIKPIFGITVDVMAEMNGKEASYPLVLLAKNNEGYRNLLKISSLVQTKSPLGIPTKWLKRYSKGLFALTAGKAGIVEQYLLNHQTDQALETVKHLSRLFEPQSFFLALQQHGTKEEKMLMEQVIHLSKETGLNVVATNEVHYLARDDAFAHECLLAIKNGQKLRDENREKLDSDQYYLKTADEMAQLFSDYPHAVENTLHIAKQCNVTIKLAEQLLPKYPVATGKTADGELEFLCQKGLKERYKQPNEEHQKRLQYELDIIKKMNFSDYFLIVWDFMMFARKRGILTGPGRGSAAGSLVAYVLYITDVDPIKHQLLFERFLNPERISMPDIDIDFPDHRRDEVIQYVVQKYGALHVAQIITFGTLAAKAAIRDVGRVFGFNTKELDQLSRLIPSKLGISLKDAYSQSEKLRSFLKESKMNHRLFETALKIEGLPRHTSTHAAGVIISEQPLINSVPIQTGHDGVYLTQYSMDHLEDLGLLKMDFLGLRNLSLIEAIIASIYKRTGKKIDIREIPFDDKRTYELLSRGETFGVFQLESEGMRNVLKRLKPTRFEDIVAVNALYRPGPMENIPLFIERKHGLTEIEYLHPELKPILENTYGVIVYQEQIMQIASKMAGFTLGEADLLRRAVGKKQKEVLDKERVHFVIGSKEKGYDEHTANRIYDLIVRFANYGFNRSHAVAYSFIAYQLAYLKATYPLDFMAALLTSAIGNEVKIRQYVQELREIGYNISPPSINLSGYSFYPENTQVRYSLAAIKGVGAAALKEIFKARRQKRFEDLFDFCIRVSPKAVNRKTLESLVHSGSFDEFGKDRAILLASIDVAVEHAQLLQPNEGEQYDFFAADEFFIKPKYVQVDPMRIEDKLLLEKEVLGLYLSDHPVSIYEKALQTIGAKLLTKITVDHNQEKVGVYISKVKEIRTKRGDSMAFLTISDQSEEVEAVVFPNVFRSLSVILKEGNIVLLQGKMEYREGRKQFIVQVGKNIKEALSEAAANKRTLYLRITKEKQSNENLQQLEKILKSFRGKTSVVLYYEIEEKAILLSKDYRVNPNSQCLQELINFLGKNNVILKH